MLVCLPAICLKLGILRRTKNNVLVLLALPSNIWKKVLARSWMGNLTEGMAAITQIQRHQGFT